MYEIEISTDSLPLGKTDCFYETVLKVTTWPKTSKILWSCENELPYGFELDKTTGTLSGTAKESFMGTVTIWAKRTDSGDSCFKRFLLQIKEEASEKLEIIRTKFPLLTFGKTCSLKLEAKGGVPPYKWKVENLPYGMKLIDGKITGIPTVGGGYFPFEITVQDQRGATDNYSCLTQIN